MTFIDFFAGVGGFRRGMELAGHQCVGFCEFDSHAVRSYISMHLLMDREREHMKTMNIRQAQKYIDTEILPKIQEREWYANDIRTINIAQLPNADCWCFGFPCQDISVAGNQLGFSGKRSSLFFAVTGIIKDLQEEDRPTTLFIENVKNLLSVNRGFDFARILVELDEIGYDAEWQVINSADYVPQNRERIFIIGHFRGRCSRQVFPIQGTNRKNNIQQIGCMKSATRNNLNQGRVYSVDGIAPCLSKMDGGGREPHILHPIALPAFCDMAIGAGLKLTRGARCLQARYNKGFSNRRGECTGVAIPVLAPDRGEKRQNGRRFKENGEPMFTLTGRDRHGVLIVVEDGAIYAIWDDEYQCYVAIRRLTPMECFRLQGWTDEYFQRAAMVSSDSQLYKQAGNGVTVPVIREIGERMG